jgi:hypothetical protein
MVQAGWKWNSKIPLLSRYRMASGPEWPGVQLTMLLLRLKELATDLVIATSAPAAMLSPEHHKRTDS